MEIQIFHIFQDTPPGREALSGTAGFCSAFGASPVVYIPRHPSFLIYFDNDVVQVDLDPVGTASPDAARADVEEVFARMGLESPKFLTPKHFTGPTLPEIPADFDFMACPRRISDLSVKMGPGFFGPRVRRILQSARFPILIPGRAFRPFTRIAVMFGGSADPFRPFKLGVWLGRMSGLPVELFTREDRRTNKTDLQGLLAQEGFAGELERSVRDWHLFSSGTIEENFRQIPNDALVVLGAPGHGLIKALFSRSTPERIQSLLPSSLLMVGPNFRPAAG